MEVGGITVAEANIK